MTRRIMLALALAGLAIAAYLSYTHATSATAFCPAGGGCEQVQSSPHLRLAGVYIPYLALGGYFGIVVSLLLRAPAALLGTLAIGWMGTAMTAYVVYLQAAVIEAWCTWCLISTALMWTITALASARYLRGSGSNGVWTQCSAGAVRGSASTARTSARA